MSYLTDMQIAPVLSLKAVFLCVSPYSVKWLKLDQAEYLSKCFS